MKKWFRMQGLIIWGVLSFIVVAGDKADDVTTIQFLAVKAAGMLSLSLCYVTIRRLHRKGLLPEIEEE